MIIMLQKYLLKLTMYLSILYILYFTSALLTPILPLYLKALELSPLFIGTVIGILGIVRIPFVPRGLFCVFRVI